MIADLTGKIAIVTGGAQGIGAGICSVLHQQGAIVVVADKNEDAAMYTSQQLSNKQSSHLGVDVTDDKSVNVMTKSVISKYRSIDILVNNAGVTRDTLLARMKSADWDLVLDTDLKSVYRMSRACLRPMMKARTGRIINITSVVGATGNAGQANYAAAKAGIEGFTRALALEVASQHITVNSVAPGFIETDMTAALDSTMRSHMLDRIPLGTLGQAADIAGAVAFLASPSANYITGHTLHVNGGMYMH